MKVTEEKVDMMDEEENIVLKLKKRGHENLETASKVAQGPRDL